MSVEISQTAFIENGTPALTVTVIDTSDLPSEIFLFRIDLEGNEIFERVATMVDLEDYSGNTHHIFKLRNTFTIYFPKFFEAQAFISDMDIRIETLDTDFKTKVELEFNGTPITRIIGE